MNKYKEALDRIVSTIIEEEADGYLELRTAGDFCWESRNILQELVDKAESFEWIPFTFDEEGVLNCELPDSGERILVSDAECMYDDESIWIDSWDSPDCGIYELESGEDLEGLAWMPLPNPYKENQNEKRIQGAFIQAKI